MKTKQPETSLAAYHSLDHESVASIQNKIVDALKIIGTGTSEQVATHLKMEHSRIWKRFSELEKDGRIINTQSKRMNRSGRNAFVYSLPDQQNNDLKKVERISKGESISDISRNIQKISSTTQQLTLL